MLNSKYSSLIGTAMALIIFIGIDRWLYQQGRLALETSNFETFYFWVLVTGLGIFAILCALSYLTLLKSQPSTPISIAMMIVGLIVYIYPIVYLSGALPLPYISYYSTPFAYTGIFFAVLGFLHFYLPKSA